MKRLKNTLLLLMYLIWVPGIPVSAQQNTTWDAWHWLMGEWTGEGEGAPGQGSGWFSFTTDLNGAVLVRRNHAEYPASQNTPGTIHDDLMVIYRDQDQQPKKAIYFDNEGHTIEYGIAYTDSTIEMTSTAKTGVPTFRLTYLRLDAHQVSVTFAMSRDGVNFIPYTTGKCRRKQ